MMNFFPTKKLIGLVSKHPCLWDLGCEEYQDKFAREAAWLAIYREAEPAYDTLQEATKSQFGIQLVKKWNNARDTYRRSLMCPRSRPYIYAEDMTFMDGNYRKINSSSSGAQSQSKILEDDIEDNNDEDEDITGEQWIKESFLDVEDIDESNNDALESKPTKRPRYDATARDERIINVLTDIIEKEEDEDRAFFQSIMPYVKSLTEDTKFEFRIQVMKLIKILKTREDKTTKISDNLKECEDDSD